MSINGRKPLLQIPIKSCRLCQQPIVGGRADKKFCSDTCKAEYHYKLNKVTTDAAYQIDRILHRNRSILIELMGKNGTQKKLNKKLLDAKKFNWTYLTHYHVNSQNKMVHYVYDFSWMIFSDQDIIIKRLR
jgi:predicted nucleic acid-binding Zn ribbon protein